MSAQDSNSGWLYPMASSGTASAISSEAAPLPYDTPWGTSVVAPSTVTSTPFHPDSALTNAGIALGYSLIDNINTALQEPQALYSSFGKQLSNTTAAIDSYGKDFSAKHAIVNPGFVTPQELQAAKLLGINPQEVGTFIPDLNSPTGFSHKEIYKNPVNTALSKEEAAKVDPSSPSFDPITAWFHTSMPANIVKDLAYPHMAATKQYQAIQDMVKQLDIVQNPNKYPAAEVAQAQKNVAAAKKESSKSWVEKTKEGLSSMVKNPMAFIHGLEGDPSILLAPELKAGTAFVGMDLAKSTEAIATTQKAIDAAKSLKTYVEANKVANKAAVLEKIDRSIPVYEKVLARGQEHLSQLQKVQKIGNVASTIGGAAGINEAQTYLAGQQSQGFTPNADLISAGATGALLGGVMEGAGKLFPEKGDIPKTHPDTANPTAGNTPATKEPGQPLHSATPIDSSKVVPYYGGVDAEGHVIHLSKGTPDTLEMKNKEGDKVPVPVKKTVAYHESIEHPLMHLTGPVSDSQLALIKERMGPYVSMPADIEAKLREGKSLSYAEAHDIATRSENHLVETLYHVDPKVYQDSLKPHIAKVAKDSATAEASDIPINLDTKPYDNMGHPEQLHGRGARPAQDAGQPGAKGNINPKLLATGAVAGGGALAGSIWGASQAAPGHKKTGAVAGGVAGGLAGLFLGLTPFGKTLDSTAGKSAQKGIFAYHLSKLHDPQMEARAQAMKDAGATPLEVQKHAGMLQLKDGQWVHEIPDEHAAVFDYKLEENTPLAAQARVGKGVPLSAIMQHPQLSIAYPGLMDKIHVRISPKLRGGEGEYNPHTGNITMGVPNSYDTSGLNTFRKTLLHEVNHAANHLEGLPRGDSPSNIRKNLEEHTQTLDSYLVDLQSRIQEAKQQGDAQRVARLQKLYAHTEKQMAYWTPEQINKTAWERYGKAGGENLSVASQDRADMTAEERRNTPVEKSFSYPVKEQITNYHKIPSPHGESPVEAPMKEVEEPISASLQRTGEMDEEGNLHGMLLEEDKLPQEHEVIAKAKEGNQQAIGALYNKYAPRLTHALRRYMVKAGPRIGLTEEDIASQAFQKAIQNLHSFKGDSAFYTWLHSIGVNEAKNAIVSSGRKITTEGLTNEGRQYGEFGARTAEVRPEVEAASAIHDTPQTSYEDTQVSNMVKHAMSRLPQDIREAMKMFHFEGLSHEEIAQKQGVPIGTVKSRLSRGKDMLKESIKKGHGANFRKQAGMTDIDTMKRIALLTGGATAGWMLGGQQHHWKDAIFGAMAGLAAGAVSLQGIKDTIAAGKAIDIHAPVSKILDRLEGNLGKANRHIDFIAAGMRKLQGENSLDIAHSLEGDTSVKLTPAQEEIKQTALRLYAHIRDMAKLAGMNMQEVLNYTTHIYKNTKENVDKLNSLMSTSPVNPKSRFAITRKGPPTIRAALEAGLELKHDNFADTFAEYMKSMENAIHSKIAIDQIKKMKDMEGNPLLVSSRSAPHGYALNPHPALRGLAVHPGVAAELSHLFDVHNPSTGEALLRQVNNAVKRVWFSWSFFHAQTLADVQSGMSLNPVKNLTSDIKSLLGKTDFQKALNNPTHGDVVDKFIEAGGRYFSGHEGFTEDIGKTVDPLMDAMQKNLEAIHPALGNLPKVAKFMDHLFTKVTFGRMGNGLMGQAFQGAFDRLQYSHIKAAEQDPSHVIPSEQELRKEAMRFASVSFGNLNWRDLANSVSSKYGRAAVMRAFTPAGRRAIQLGLAAPEWFVSTSLHWLRAFSPTGHGFEGMINPKNATDLHRVWLAKSVISYMIWANAINYMFTGKYTWQNKDPLMIDLGDGRKTPMAKELTDFPRFLEQPAQESLNKLGPIPKMAGQQVMGTTYLSAKGHAPRMKTAGDRVQNLLGGISPISTAQNSTAGIPGDIAGFFGHPVYGESNAQRAAKKEAGRRKAAYTRHMHALSKEYGGQ